MGIEKITGSGAMSYQGSAAAAPSTVQASAAAVQASEAVVQMNDQVAQAKGQGKQGADMSSGKNSGEGLERGEDASAKQGTRLKEAVSDLNKKMVDSEAIFGIHEKTNRVTIKIVDKTTKEVIKEFPPEQTLDMIAKLWEAAGIMVDEKR